MTTHPDVVIREVGPRDGLQSVKSVMPTAAKLRWIDALYAAGVREIEVASFVPARLLPQMADAAEVVRHAITLPGLVVMALVPNLRGAEAALAAGVHKAHHAGVEIGSHAGAAHMHNTRGLGLANCLAAYVEGVRTFDASLGAWAAARMHPARRAMW